MRLFVLLIFLYFVAEEALKISSSFKKAPQILKVEEFWRVNGGYINDGEVYEVFYPPLKPLDN